MGVNPKALLLSLVNKEIDLNGTRTYRNCHSEINVAGTRCKAPIQKHQTVKRQFTVKRANSNNMPQKSNIRRYMQGKKCKKILVDFGLIPRYTTEPYMGLSF